MTCTREDRVSMKLKWLRLTIWKWIFLHITPRIYVPHLHQCLYIPRIWQKTFFHTARRNFLPFTFSQVYRPTASTQHNNFDNTQLCFPDKLYKVWSMNYKYFKTQNILKHEVSNLPINVVSCETKLHVQCKRTTWHNPETVPKKVSILHVPCYYPSRLLERSAKKVLNTIKHALHENCTNEKFL